MALIQPRLEVRILPPLPAPVLSARGDDPPSLGPAADLHRTILDACPITSSLCTLICRLSLCPPIRWTYLPPFQTSAVAMSSSFATMRANSRRYSRGIGFRGTTRQPRTRQLGDGELPFDTKSGGLTGGTPTVMLPAPVGVVDKILVASLEATLTISRPWRPCFDAVAAGRSGRRTCGQHGWFDDELGELVRLLPSTVRLLDRYTCGLSDYHPVGYGLRGGLACFRGVKETDRGVQGTVGIFRVWESMTQWAHGDPTLCSEWPRCAHPSRLSRLAEHSARATAQARAPRTGQVPTQTNRGPYQPRTASAQERTPN